LRGKSFKLLKSTTYILQNLLKNNAEQDMKLDALWLTYLYSYGKATRTANPSL